MSNILLYSAVFCFVLFFIQKKFIYSIYEGKHNIFTMIIKVSLFLNLLFCLNFILNTK